MARQKRKQKRSLAFKSSGCEITRLAHATVGMFCMHITGRGDALSCFRHLRSCACSHITRGAAVRTT